MIFVNEKTAHLVILIDTSISQAGKEKEMHETCLRITEYYRKNYSKCFITLGTFADRLKMHFAGSDAGLTGEVPLRGLSAFGPTGLYDATAEILRSADGFNEIVRSDIEMEKHLYVISDGLDNASVALGEEDFSLMIKKRRENGWTIRFIDSFGRRTAAGRHSAY